jgi:hypothetical protein
MMRIHGVDIYDGFPIDDFHLDLNDWHSTHPFFEEYIARNRPKLIVELGTWKGSSAIHMATIVKRLALDCSIICIDTWLGHWRWWVNKNIASQGSTEGRDNESRTLWKEINPQHGWPMVYNQFVANVMHTDNSGIIIPIPQTTEHGMMMLKHWGVHPDMIYIDADHRYVSVYRDLNDAFSLLAPGGVILGDDYSADYPGVIQAVDEFISEKKLSLHIHEPNKWAVVTCGA